ncbi:MAG TPA: hypothetical protein DEX10_07755 [Betaproteobacteria bacterium]|nr:hypothetical protein [Betaproteobacteria bacterium]
MRVFIYTILLAFVYAILMGAFVGLLAEVLPFNIDFSEYGLRLLFSLFALLLFPSYFVARRMNHR